MEEYSIRFWYRSIGSFYQHLSNCLDISIPPCIVEMKLEDMKLSKDAIPKNKVVELVNKMAEVISDETKKNKFVFQMLPYHK